MNNNDLQPIILCRFNTLTTPIIFCKSSKHQRAYLIKIVQRRKLAIEFAQR